MNKTTIGVRECYELNFNELHSWYEADFYNYFQYTTNPTSQKMSSILLRHSGLVDMALVSVENKAPAFTIRLIDGVNSTNVIQFNPSSLQLFEEFHYQNICYTTLSNWLAKDPDGTYHNSLLATPKLCIDQPGVSLP
jgi:hypothetical protein